MFSWAKHTLRSLLYVLVLLYVLDNLNKNPSYCFFYYYTTLPIIRTGRKISLHLQMYVLVDLKNMSWNVYKTSTYNRNLRVEFLKAKHMKCFLYLIQIFEIRQLGFDQLDGERHFFSPTGGAMLKWWRPLNWAMWKIQQETETTYKTKQGIRANHYWVKNLLKCQVKMGWS